MATAIVSGAIADRTKFLTCCSYSGLISLVIKIRTGERGYDALQDE